MAPEKLGMTERKLRSPECFHNWAGCPGLPLESVDDEKVYPQS